MSEIDITSCRVCLKPDGTFISIYNKINDQDVLTLIHNVTKMVIIQSPKLSHTICDYCLSQLLMAENIINLFDKNQQLLQQLLNDENIFEFDPSDPENMKNTFLLKQIVDNLDGDAFLNEYIVSGECLNSVYLEEIHEQQVDEQNQQDYEEIQRVFEDIQLDYDDLQQEDEQVQLEFEEIQQENREPHLKENVVPQLKSQKVKVIIQEVDWSKLSSKVVENEILKQQLEDEKIDWSKLSTKVRKNRFVSCSHCGKQFKSLSPLAKHEMVNHPKCAITKPFYCDMCGINFRFKAYLKNHIKKVHVRDYKYQCNICSFKMYAKTQYTNHMKGHDPKAEKQFSCNICDKRFDRKENLLVHHRMHTGERPYKCEHCPKSYMHSTDYKRHQVVHTGHLPFSCTMCNSGFRRRGQLLEHQNKLHPIMKTNSLQISNVINK